MSAILVTAEACVGHCNICRAQYSPRPIHQLLCVSYSHVHLTMGVYIKQ